MDFVYGELIDVIQPYPGPNSIIIVDNCATHHNPAFKQVIDDMGAWLIYLPPYEPWLNLAEHHFHGIKTLERSKNINGIGPAYESLLDSVQAMNDRNWSGTLRKIGVM